MVSGDKEDIQIFVMRKVRDIIGGTNNAAEDFWLKGLDAEGYIESVSSILHVPMGLKSPVKEVRLKTI